MDFTLFNNTDKRVVDDLKVQPNRKFELHQEMVALQKKLKA